MAPQNTLLNQSYHLERLTVGPQEPIGVHGLFIARGIDVGFVNDFVEATEEYGTLFRSRPKYQINLVKPHEVKEQASITSFSHIEVQDALRERVPTLMLPKIIEVEGIGMIPIKDDEGSIVIIDLTRESQEDVLAERQAILEVLESFAPQAIFNWMTYKKPGIPIGVVRPHNTAYERKTVRTAIRSHLPGELRLHSAKVRPKVNRRS